MFGILSNVVSGVAKATVSVAVAPVAVVADSVMLIPDSCNSDGNTTPFSRTTSCVKGFVDGVEEIVDFDKK